MSSTCAEPVTTLFDGLNREIDFSFKGKEIMTLRSDNFKINDSETPSNPKPTHKTKTSLRLNCEPAKVMLETTLSFKNLVQDMKNSGSDTPKYKFGGPDGKLEPLITLPDPVIMFSPRPVSELDAAAVKLQKVYKSYRTRRNLADCAVVVEELWWKALDFAALKLSSVSFFDGDKHETAISRWGRARTRAAKVGKGLSKDEKAQKLALQHWLEAIDPRHRYGHNLHMYNDIWFASESTQPFFYWLDVGNGKEVNVKACPRTNLNRQCIKYLGPNERLAYEVIVQDGKLMYKQSGLFIETTEDCKWIFVLSTLRTLYVGQKKKGSFQHSSFLSGGATTAAGRLVAHKGVLEAIWPYSGHYHPTEENFLEFISFLQDHQVDLTNVKRCAIDDDYPSFRAPSQETEPLIYTTTDTQPEVNDTYITTDHKEEKENNNEAQVFEFTNRLSCKWSTGTGPRIGCVRDYPSELQFRALEQVNLSPRVALGSFGNYGPIPSPRPSPKVRLSPRLAYIGLPSPRTPISTAN